MNLKAYIFINFYQQYLVLFTIALRNNEQLFLSALFPHHFTIILQRFFNLNFHTKNYKLLSSCLFTPHSFSSRTRHPGTCTKTFFPLPLKPLTVLSLGGPAAQNVLAVPSLGSPDAQRPLAVPSLAGPATLKRSGGSLTRRSPNALHSDTYEDGQQEE